MLEISMFLDLDDTHEGKPLLEHIMRYLMHHGIIGASVLAPTMGYGRKHHLHHPRDIGNVDERPIIILFVDETEKVKAVLPELKRLVRDGLIIARSVERM